MDKRRYGKGRRAKLAPEIAEKTKLAISRAAIEKAIAQAELIGWPLLAESFRRDLAKLGDK